MAVSQNGKFLAAVGFGTQVRLWRTDDWSELDSLQAGRDQTEIAFSKAGLLATGDGQGRVTLWNPEQQSMLGSPLETGQSLNCLTFSPDGSQLLTGSGRRDGEDASEGAVPCLMVWDIESRARKTLVNEQRDVAALGWALRDDDSVIAAGFSDGKIRLWDGVSLKESHELAADGPVNAIAFSPDALPQNLGLSRRLRRRSATTADSRHH